MSGKRHVVRVSIVGEEYSIRSDVSPEHTRAVSEYLDKAIRAITSGSGVVEIHKAAILAALQITNELFEARAAAAQSAEEMSALGDEIRRWLPPAKRGERAG